MPRAATRPPRHEQGDELAPPHGLSPRPRITNQYSRQGRASQQKRTLQSALRIERLLAKVEAELACSARPRRYVFHYDEVAEAEANDARLSQKSSTRRFSKRKNSTPRITIGTFWRWHQPPGNQCVHQDKNRSKALLTWSASGVITHFGRSRCTR